MKIWTDFSFVLSQSMSFTDGWTEGQLSPHQTALHSTQRGNYRDLKFHAARKGSPFATEMLCLGSASVFQRCLGREKVNRFD